MSSPTGSKLLVTGVAVTVVGGFVGFAGAVITAFAAVGIARRRIDQMEVPPADLARQQWQRARVAATAGAGAWRNGSVAAPATQLS